jgi:hypothetical protein
MNRNIFYVAFVFVILATCISSRSLSDSSIDVETNNSSYKVPTLMQVLQSIFDDPEFLALSDYEQLKVLDVIYSILESSYAQPKSHAKSAFFN